MIDEILHFKTDIEVSAGKLLISEPMLQDASFSRSVVYLAHHDHQESVGYILNRKAPRDLSCYLDALEGFYFPLYNGGPVGQDSLHVLHRVPGLIGGEPVSQDVCWGGELDEAIRLIKTGKILAHQCRFFIGYSGWSTGQLDAELDMNAWLVAGSTPKLVFETSEEVLWKESIGTLGKKFNPLLFLPVKPELN